MIEQGHVNEQFHVENITNHNGLKIFELLILCALFGLIYRFRLIIKKIINLILAKLTLKKKNENDNTEVRKTSDNI